MVSWTVKKTNEWFLNKAGEKRELSDTVKTKKISILWSHLEKETMQGTMPVAYRRYFLLIFVHSVKRLNTLVYSAPPCAASELL